MTEYSYILEHITRSVLDQIGCSMAQFENQLIYLPQGQFGRELVSSWRLVKSLNDLRRIEDGRKRLIKTLEWERKYAQHFRDFG